MNSTSETGPDAYEPRSARFGRLTVRFDGHVLEPRPWTLAQSAWAAELLAAAPGGHVLELFAGVGHIGLAAVAQTTRSLVQVDLNPAACTWARLNAHAAGLRARVEVREGSIDEAVGRDERFAVIIADPPWVPSAQIGQFPEDPSIAIDGGGDGLVLAKAACQVIERHLADGGSAVLQIGTTAQVAQLSDSLGAEGSSLYVAETRAFERGVLALLRHDDRPPRD